MRGWLQFARPGRHGWKRTSLAALWVAAALWAVVGSQPPVAKSYCHLSTGNPTPGDGGQCRDPGEPLSWHTPCVSYSLVYRDRDSLDFDDIRDAVAFSFQAWTEAECDGHPVALEVAQTEALSECAEPAHNQMAGNVNTVAFIDDWVAEGYDHEAFALTKVWHDQNTGNIYGADLLLNEDMGEYADCGTTPCPDKIDIENVVTHEAGHFLGLGHSKWPNATMFFQAQMGEVKKRGLDRDDIEGLCALYGPRGEEPICKPHNFVPRGGFDPTCDPEPTSGCGCRLGRSGPPGPTLAVLAVLALVAVRARRRR